MKGSQLHAQSPRRALLWSGRTGPFTSSSPKDYSRELKSSVCVIFLKWHCKKALPHCITPRRLCGFSAVTIHRYNPEKDGGWQWPQLQYTGTLKAATSQYFVELKPLPEFPSSFSNSNQTAFLSCLWFSWDSCQVLSGCIYSHLLSRSKSVSTLDAD